MPPGLMPLSLERLARRPGQPVRTGKVTEQSHEKRSCLAESSATRGTIETPGRENRSRTCGVSRSLTKKLRLPGRASLPPRCDLEDHKGSGQPWMFPPVRAPPPAMDLRSAVEASHGEQLVTASMQGMPGDPSRFSNGVATEALAVRQLIGRRQSAQAASATARPLRRREVARVARPKTAAAAYSVDWR
jgi:hypothetical protein